MPFVPNRYQAEIFRFAREEKGNAIISALAGSGKSRSLVEATKSWPSIRSAVFCAFNKAIAKTLESRVARTGWKARTIHSLGLSVMGRFLQDFQVEPQKTRLLLLQELGVDNARQYRGFRGLHMAVSSLVSHLKTGLVGFNRDGTLDERQIEQSIEPLALEYDVDIAESGHETGLVKDLIKDVYAASMRCTHLLDFDDMITMPVFFARQIVFPRYDALLVDEVQDLNAAQVELILHLSGPGGRIMSVGDRQQCQPPGCCVRLEGGEAKRIADIKVGDRLLVFDRHSKCFVGRVYQGREVRAVGRRKYRGQMLTISAGELSTDCTPNHKWLVRWNRSVKNNVVYLMRKGDWFRVGWCQLFDAKGSLHLGVRARLEDADAAWVLDVFDNKADASIYESIVAARYGLPLITFRPVHSNHLQTEENIRRVFESVPEMMYRSNQCLIDHGRCMDYPLYYKISKQRRGRTTLFVTEACNLMSDMMSVPVYDGRRNERWEPIKVDSRTYVGYVYSLDVDGGFYTVDDIVTHNSIYGWRGAMSNSMDVVRDRTGAVELPLSICYRCDHAIIDEARRYVPAIEPRPDAGPGVVRVIPERALGVEVRPGDFVLCRTNAPLIGLCMQLLVQGMPAHIQGRDIGKNLAAFTRKLSGENSSMPSADLLGKVEGFRAKMHGRLADTDREHLLVAIDDKCAAVRAFAEVRDTAGEVAHAFEELFADDVQGVTLSTVHKAKGLEADRVFILRPDLLPHPYAKLDWQLDQERNLSYVAVTRARHELVYAEPEKKRVDR